jgi:hypothetical protein
VPEQRHQRLQRHTRVDQGGGVGVPELVRGGVRQAGLAGDLAQRLLQVLGGDPLAVAGEQELGGPPGARVRDGPARRAARDDPVDEGEGFLVDGHHPLGVQLAQRHLQPRALAGNLVHAVELEIDDLPDAQPGGPGQQQRIGRQPVRPDVQGLGETSVEVGGEVAGSGRSSFGTSARNSSLRAGASGQPHSVISAKKRLTAITRARRSPTASGAPVRVLVARAAATR